MAQGDRRVILLVDGEDERRAAAAEALQERGFGVLEVARENEALRLLSGYSAVDPLVCAIPSVAGVALAHAAQRVRPGLQVLLLEEDERAAAGLPAPPAATDRAGLVATVERLLRGGEPAASEPSGRQ